jgi:hypothetical protein
MEGKSRAQIVAAHKGRRQEHIVRKRREAVSRIAKDAEALAGYFQNAVSVNHAAMTAVVGEDFEDQLVLGPNAAYAQAKGSSEIVKLLHRPTLIVVQDH